MQFTSPSFEDRIISVHGQTGRNWLKSLPKLQEKLAQRWSLRDLQPIQDPSYNYLAYATTSEDRSAVLKLGVPHLELETEIQALHVFNGNGAVRLLKTDNSLGALLLERILPGDDLRTISDDQKTSRIAAHLMQQVWKPVPREHIFPTSADWCLGFQRYLDKYPQDGPIPPDLVEQAANLSKKLLDTSEKQVLLHGDLHHMNILLGENENWIAIDPKGVIGEPAFEVGALLLNPVPDLVSWPDLEKVQDQRLIILEEILNIRKKRLIDWSFVRAVLSAIWSLEDGGNVNYQIKVAEGLRSLR